MASLASINILFRVNTRDLSTQMQTAIRECNRVGGAFQDLGKSMTTYVTLPLAGLGVAALKTFGDLEALQKGLTSVMGSSAAAAAEFENLKEVAKLPGLGLEEAVRGSVNMQAAGFSADEARKSLLAFGNALATVGKGKRELDLVVLALTQLNNKNTGFGQDLRQLMEQLPQLRGALSAAFGTADSEAIAKMGVTGRQVVQMLTKEFAKLPKVTAGFNNALENVGDNIKITLAGIGGTINKTFNVEGILNSFSDSLLEVSEAFQNLSPRMQSFVVTTAAVAAAIGPLSIAIGTTIKFLPILTTGFTALSGSMLPILAIAAAVTLALLAFGNRSKELTREQYQLADAQKLNTQVFGEANKMIISQKAELERLVLVARNLNEPMASRKAAIEAINKISPEYLGNLSVETIRTDEATKSINKYNEALFKGALARAAQKEIDANAGERVQAQLVFEKKLFDYQQKKTEAESKGQKATIQFWKDEGGAMERAYLRYQDKLEQLDKEDKQLAGIVNANEKYTGLIKSQEEAVNALATAEAKAGTIKYYEDKIAALKKLQNETVTNSRAWLNLEQQIQSFQNRIDQIKAIRLPVMTIKAKIEADGGMVKGPELDPSANKAYVNGLQQQIDMWKGIQAAYVETDPSYVLAEKRIKSLTDLMTTTQTGKLPLLETIEQIPNALTPAQKAMQDFESRMLDFNKSLSDGVHQLEVDLVSGLAESIGSLATGAEGLGGIFEGLGAMVGDFLMQMGKQLISAGIAFKSFEKLASNPSAAIVAGVAAIAAGAAFKAFVKKGFAGKYAEGGVIPGNSYYGDRLYAAVNSGELILNQDQQKKLYGMIQPSVAGGESVFIPDVRISGQDLIVVFDRANKRKDRTG